MAFKDDFAHKQLTKGITKVGVAYVLICIHHDDQTITLGDPRMAGGKQVIKESLSRAFRAAASTAKEPDVLLVGGTNVETMTRPIGGYNPGTM